MKTEQIHQVMAVMPIFLNYFMIGIGIGWMAPVLNQLRNSSFEGLSLTDEQCSLIPSLYYITRALGPFFAAVLVDRVGRNPVLIITALINCLIWVIILTTRAVIWHYITRILFGTVTGMNESTIGIYIGENCSPEIRGIISTLTIVFFYIGELSAFILATYLSYDNVAIVQSGFGLLAILCTFLLKEPAQFLIMKGELERAEENYYWLRNSQGEDVKLQFEEIKHNVLEEKLKTSFIEGCREPIARKSLKIILVIMVLMMLTGFVAVNTYITMTITESENLTQNEYTIIYGIFQFICGCISSFFVEKFNRRSLLLLTCASMAIFQASTAFLYYSQRMWSVPCFNWLLFATLTAYSCTFGMFMYPLSTAIRGELLPQSVKALGNSICVAASSLSGCLSTMTFLPIANAYGMEINFILFTAFSSVLFAYVYLDLPETRGKSLIQIQRELRTKLK